MKNLNKVVAAVDVGTSKVVVVIGRLTNNGKLEILGNGESELSESLQAGEVKNIDAVATAIDAAVYKTNTDATIDEVYVNVTGVRYASKTISVGVDFEEEECVAMQDLHNLMIKASSLKLEQNMQIYHIEPQEFWVDNIEYINPIGVLGKHLNSNFFVICGDQTYAKKLNIALNKSMLRIDRLLIDPLSTNEILLSTNEKEAGVVVLEIGAGLSKMAVYTKGHLRMQKTFQCAGETLTKDLVEECRISSLDAEYIKNAYGIALGTLAPDNKFISIPNTNGWEQRELNIRMIAKILQSRITEIVDIVKYNLEKSNLIDKIGAGIVITGGTAKLTHISELVKQQLKMNVRIGFPNIEQEEFRDLKDPKYSAVIGLLKYGLLDETESIATKSKDSKETKAKQKEKKINETSKEPSTITKLLNKAADSLSNVASDFFKQ